MEKRPVERGFSGASASPRPWVYPKPELEGFLLSRECEGCSPATLATYRHRISQFLRYVHQYKPGLDLPGIRRAHIEHYLLELRNRDCSPDYIKSTFIGIRTFFKWCVEERFIDVSPAQNIKAPRVPKKSKPFITEVQRDRLLALCPPNRYLGARNAAIIWLFWTTGMRLSEVAGLKLADLDWERSRIRVFGKGARERWVPFLPEAKKSVWRYIAYRDDKLPQLWLSEERRPMTRDGIDSMTQRLVIRAGLHGEIKDLHHTFRRAWAARQIRAGVPTKYVQMVGGWESLSVLERYVRAMDIDDALGANWV